MTAIRVSKLIRTSAQAPSQWEGSTVDGLVVYVRYRWGRLNIGSGATLAEAVKNGNNVFEKQIGSKLDRMLEYDKLREITAGVIEWPENFQNK